MICINCNYEHDEKFCPNCGERAAVPAITLASISNDLFSTLIQMNKGFLYNVKQLFLNPNKIVSDYIRGKRKNIYNPISFLVLMVTIYLIVDSLIKTSGNASGLKSDNYTVGLEAGRFIRTNFKYFWILSIIWLSFSTKLVFRKYNFAEHLAINSFVIGQATLIGLVGLVVFRIPVILDPFVYIFIIWLLSQIFKKKNSPMEIVVKSFSATLLFFLQLILIAFLVVIIKMYV